MVVIAHDWKSVWKGQEDLEQVGAVFTRPEIVSLVLDLSGYLPAASRLVEKRLLEPSCGDGSFLKEIVNRLIDSEHRHRGRHHRSEHQGRVPRSRGAPLSDAAAFAYVSSTFSFTDRTGRILSMQSCGTRRTSDLVWVCVEARSPAGLTPLSVRNAVMCDLFDDQVNVVQGTVGRARRSLLFTKGDRAKPLT